ncbi:sulfite exporter TauE/SafE family protein [Thalassotalea aquiviva]|uniref:sulfite exporter TauE/SafE family protein n=1 Tax=Thalassotalea aquiviva TaxID=3242415 RepID=UPI00352AB104
MTELINILPFLCLMIATGIIAGILAGLLGVGGGIVIVPVLDFALGYYQVEESVRMQIAVATSMACILLSSLSSARAHYLKGSLIVVIIKKWSGFILLGAFIGSMIASLVSAVVLTMVFAVVALWVAINMFFKHKERSETIIKTERSWHLGIPFGIGTLSALMGIGGGTFSVPILTRLGYSVHRSVGTAALLGFFISLPATLGYVIMGYSNPSLPQASLGFVNVLGVIAISPLMVVCAPLGVKIAHQLTQQQLARVFALFLLLVGVRMLYRSVEILI